MNTKSVPPLAMIDASHSVAIATRRAHCEVTLTLALAERVAGDESRSHLSSAIVVVGDPLVHRPTFVAGKCSSLSMM